MKKLVLALPILIFTALPLVAQDNQIGLTVFPAIFERAVEPDESLDGTIRIENTSANPLPLNASVTSLQPFGTVENADDIERYDSSAWIELSEDQILVDSGQTYELGYSVDVPKDASPGGHYAQVVLRELQLSQSRPSQSSANIIPEVNALVFITVAGDINESLSIDTSSLVDHRIDHSSVVNFNISLINNGNVHVLPKVALILSRGDETVETINFAPKVVLPGTSQNYSSEWLADDAYGNYDAKVVVSYGTPETTIESGNTTFTVAPPVWQIVLAVVSGVLVILLIIRWRQIPRAVSVLKGRAAGIAGSYKQSGGSQELDENYDNDYSEIIKELDRQRPILGLPPDEKPVIADEATSKVTEQTEKQEASKRKTAKTQEMIAEEIRRDAQISEELHSDTNSKTVIIQTGASTIVREEPLATPAETAPEEPKVTKIMVLDHDEKQDAGKRKTENRKQKKSKKQSGKKKNTKARKKGGKREKGNRKQKKSNKKAPKKAANKKPAKKGSKPKTGNRKQNKK